MVEPAHHIYNIFECYLTSEKDRREQLELYHKCHSRISLRDLHLARLLHYVPAVPTKGCPLNTVPSTLILRSRLGFANASRPGEHHPPTLVPFDTSDQVPYHFCAQMLYRSNFAAGFHMNQCCDAAGGLAKPTVSIRDNTRGFTHVDSSSWRRPAD